MMRFVPVYIHICSQALTWCSMCTIPQARWDLSQESCIAVKCFECSTFFHKLSCNIIIFCASHTEQIPCYDLAGILTAWCMTRGAGWSQKGGRMWKKLVLELNVSATSSVTERIRSKTAVLNTLALNTSTALLKSSRVFTVIKQLGWILACEPQCLLLI